MTRIESLAILQESITGAFGLAKTGVVVLVVPFHVPSFRPLRHTNRLTVATLSLLLALSSADQYIEPMTDHREPSLIQADFDQLAAFSTDGWDHNSHYHHFF